MEVKDRILYIVEGAGIFFQFIQKFKIRSKFENLTHFSIIKGFIFALITVNRPNFRKLIIQNIAGNKACRGETHVYVDSLMENQTPALIILSRQTSFQII